MDISAKTDNQKCTLSFELKTRGQQQLRFIVVDPYKENTVYADAPITINEHGYFYIRMPISPKNALVRVFNVNHGNLKDDPTFNLRMKKDVLKTNLNAFNVYNSDITAYLTLISEFAENAGILSAGNRSVYLSDEPGTDGKHFRIDYVDVCRDEKGNELSTPARISTANKRVEFAQKHIINYTVPAIVAAGLHEFGHGYMVKEPTKNDIKRYMLKYKVNAKTAELLYNEMEADLNALRIYLGSGFSRKEAYRIFCKVFAGSPSKVNNIRYQAIEQFIIKFEKEPNINYQYYYIGENGEKS